MRKASSRVQFCAALMATPALFFPVAMKYIISHGLIGPTLVASLPPPTGMPAGPMMSRTLRNGVPPALPVYAVPCTVRPALMSRIALIWSSVMTFTWVSDRRGGGVPLLVRIHVERDFLRRRRMLVHRPAVLRGELAMVDEARRRGADLHALADAVEAEHVVAQPDEIADHPGAGHVQRRRGVELAVQEGPDAHVQLARAPQAERSEE